MSMSKKDFIALADELKRYNEYHQPQDRHSLQFTPYHIEVLADFCAAQNPRFHRDRWLAYIAGICGPNGGKVKVTA